MAVPSSNNLAKAWVAVLLITVVAFLLRLYGLGNQSLWADETFTMLAVRQPFSAMMEQLQQDFVHPPLHYIILHWIHSLVGLDVVTARFVSVIFGTLSVPIMYLAGKYLFNKRTGVLAAVILALSQLGVMYSQEARDYALQMFFVAATLLFLGHFKRSGSSWAWWALVVSTIAALYTHYYSLFVVGPLLLWAAYGAFKKGSIGILQIAFGLLLLPLSQVPWLASGIIDIAVAAPKTMRDQPHWYEVDWSTIFNTLNKFNNGSVKHMLPPGPSWSYAVGALLFTAPLFAIRQKSRKAKRDLSAFAWLTATIVVGIVALTTPSGTSGLAVVALCGGKSVLEFLRGTSFGSTTTYKWLSAPAVWTVVLLLALPIALTRDAPGWVMFVVALMFSVSAYEYLRGRYVKLRPAPQEDGLEAVVLLLTAALGIGVPILLGIVDIQYETRYSLAALPLYYILVAYGLMQIESGWIQRLAIGAICVYSIFALNTNYLSPYKENWRDSMTLVIENYQPADCVVFPPWDALPTTWYAYGFDKQLPTMRFLPAPDLEAKVDSCDRVWVLQYSRVPSVPERGRPFVELIEQYFDAQQTWSFNWVGVTLYARREAVDVASLQTTAVPNRAE